MTETVWSEGNADPTTGGRVDRRPSTRSSVVALLALVGIAAVIGVIDLLVQGQTPSAAAALASWGWVVNVILVILAIVIIVMVLRLVFRGVGVSPHDRTRERRARRHGYNVGVPYRDPAVDIARARYARGEISQDQLDRTLAQLGKSS
jgi:uncharacterized membrane protein